MVADSVLAALQLFDDTLDEWARRHFGGEGALAKAIEYALAGRGKRIRPILSLLACEAVCGRQEPALAGAMAIELIHTYSLIHDDLPCMDNDTLRRGRPTLHVAFDEASALLVGDALLTDAFCLVAANHPELPDAALLPPLQRLSMIATIARAAGSQGMVYGQALDMMWTGQGSASLHDLDEVHRHKTGCLMRASAAVGAIAGGASPEVVAAFERLGMTIGLAFQIRDDVLDEQSGTGKSVGKDCAQGKLTYLSLMTASEAMARVAQLTQEALAVIQPFGTKASTLQSWVRSLVQRET